jgi:hypothetical protein
MVLKREKKISILNHGDDMVSTEMRMVGTASRALRVAR